ncbi:hypothetical protein ASB57_13200 [Bordetella sp. N]|nr:hypothetical protein ASB57_13200 [Bordetella sp. N]
MTGEEWLALGRLLQDTGRHAEAVPALQQAASRLPLNADVYLALVVSLDATEQKADAASARLGADAIARRRASDIFDIGRVYAKHKQWEAAAHWLEKALLIEPGLAPAHICLAWALRQMGRREQAGQIDPRRRRLYLNYRHQPAFSAAKATRRRSVLIMCSSQVANLPFGHLLPPAHNRTFKWVMDEGEAGMLRGRSKRLPPYDVIFNVISDADRGASCREAQARFMAADHGPILNPPERIDRTYREYTGALLAGVPDILVPTTMRWDRQSNPAFVIHAALERGGVGYPALVRPVGEHGGDGIVLLASRSDPTDPPTQGEMYLTRYHEYRSPDGYFRKYRVIFIDRVPYPYHLAIGSQWLLHYFSADMLSDQWKLDEERRFLDDPAQALGAKAWAALHAIAQRMDLDYCGIDFSLLPDGRVLVFETNASMLVHPEAEQDRLRFKNVYIDRIFDAFDALLARHAASAQ